MFRFTIRELLLLTVIVALVVAWWLDRSAVDASRNQATIRANEAMKEAKSCLALSEALRRQLQNKNPAASINITVRGGGSTTSTRYSPPMTQATHADEP